MRVLYWIERFWPEIGGVQVRSAKLIPALRARGHEFLVVTCRGHNEWLPDEDDYDGLPIRRFSFLEAVNNRDVELLAESLAGVARLKRQFRPDVVHVGEVGPAVLFHLRSAAACPAPSVVTLTQHLPPQVGGADSLLVEALRSADWVVGCSQAVLRRVCEVAPQIASRSSVIYNGWEAPPVEPAPLPFEPPVLLCLGRLVDYKGFDLALTALAALVGRFPGLRMIVAGDGPDRGELEAQAERLGLAASVEFLGWVEPDGVYEVINRATLALMPSRAEAFGNAAAQALLMARPVVASRVGGLPEVVLDGQTGRLFEAGDAAGLVDATARLLADPDQARRMGQAGRRHVLDDFNFHRHVVDGYDAIYRRLARGL